MRRRTALAALVVVALAGAVATESAPAATAPALVVRTSSFGPILHDGRGYALYAFTSDRRGRSTCYGPCARAWPPYLVTTRPRPGKGTMAALVATVRRRDGSRQATYAGRPLYFYVGDKPGVVLCQNVREYGGLWLVVRGSGAPVRS